MVDRLWMVFGDFANSANPFSGSFPDDSDASQQHDKFICVLETKHWIILQFKRDVLSTEKMAIV